MGDCVVVDHFTFDGRESSFVIVGIGLSARVIGSSGSGGRELQRILLFLFQFSSVLFQFCFSSVSVGVLGCDSIPPGGGT